MEHILLTMNKHPKSEDEEAKPKKVLVRHSEIVHARRVKDGTVTVVDREGASPLFVSDTPEEIYALIEYAVNGVYYVEEKAHD